MHVHVCGGIPIGLSPRNSSPSGVHTCMIMCIIITHEIKKGLDLSESYTWCWRSHYSCWWRHRVSATPFIRIWKEDKYQHQQYDVCYEMNVVHIHSFGGIPIGLSRLHSSSSGAKHWKEIHALYALMIWMVNLHESNICTWLRWYPHWIFFSPFILI